jgi:hypothetical protein
MHVCVGRGYTVAFTICAAMLRRPIDRDECMLSLPMPLLMDAHIPSNLQFG